MLIFSQAHSKYVIDPYYLSIIPFKKIWDADKSRGKSLAEAILMCIYSWYNPHSPFKEYKRREKLGAIVKAYLPADLVNEGLKWEPYALDYDNSHMTPDMWDACSWYKDHLQKTPLWYAYFGLQTAMHNLADKVADPAATPQQIKTAQEVLSRMPVELQKMKEQAEKDEAHTLKVQGDKSIRRSERLPVGKKATAITAPDGSNSEVQKMV